jgi:hypothetical protein
LWLRDNASTRNSVSDNKDKFNMANVHQDTAMAALAALAATDCEPATFGNEITKLFPAWRSNAAPMLGYGDPGHHAAVFTSRCLRDSLPPPFNVTPYEWEKQQGFSNVMAWVAQPGRTSADVLAVVEAAMVEADRVANDRQPVVSAAAEPTPVAKASPAAKSSRFDR